MIENRVKYLLYSIAENSDRAAFGELFCSYYPGLVSFSNSIIGDQQQSEEVVEDVFVKLWENRRIMTTIRNFSHYIYTAAKYASFNVLKSKNRINYEEMGDDFTLSNTTPETKMISSENLAKITAAINSLPPRCRLIFRLIKENGLRYDEVAQLLNISVKTVESQMMIALKKLMLILAALLPEYKTAILKRNAK